MGVRAVMVVYDDTGRHRRLWAAWASKQYQIAHLARFVHTADGGGVPLSVDGYLAYASAHPGTLPAEDITDAGWYADPDEVGDLDHRYELALGTAERTFRYAVCGRDDDHRRWRRSEEVADRTHLYAAAARMCRELATGTARYAERNGGVLPVRWPCPQDWREQAHTFTEWLVRTDEQLLHRSGSVSQPVPPWFSVRAARVTARRVGAALRQRYPGTIMRTRVSAGGAIDLTVPTHLARDGEASRVADVVGRVLGQSLAVTVRPHRRRRRGGVPAEADQPPVVYATLTLRPRRTVAAATEAAPEPGASRHTGS